MSKSSWQNVELVLCNPPVLFAILLLVPSAIWPVSTGFNLQGYETKFFGFSESAEDGSPRASRPSKRVLMYPMSTVYQAASKNRGKSCL